MADQFEIVADKKAFRRLEHALKGVKNGFERAAVSAINRTLTTGRSRIAKRVGDELKIRRKALLQQRRSRQVMRLDKATRSRISGAIKLTRVPIPLIEFASAANRVPTVEKKRRKPPVVQVRKGGQKERLSNAFVARMPSGHVGIFERKKQGDSRSRRLPIEERYGPSLLGVFENQPGLSRGVLDDIGEVLEKNIDSQIDRFLQKRLRRPAGAA